MRGLRRLLTILFVAVLAGGAVWAIVGRGAPPQPRPGTQIEADAPMPVLAAKASLADVPVYLDGVGAVRALNMVRVHTLVDSTLIALKASSPVWALARGIDGQPRPSVRRPVSFPTGSRAS